MSKENTSEEAPFNMAMMFYFRISKLMEEKDKAAITQNILVWFNCLRAIYRNIKFKLTTKEKEDLDAKFSNVADKLEDRKTALNGRVASQVNDMVMLDTS